MGCTQGKQPKVKLTPEEIKELEACREAILQCMKASRQGQQYSQSARTYTPKTNYLYTTYSDSTLPTKNSISSPTKK